MRKNPKTKQKSGKTTEEKKGKRTNEKNLKKRAKIKGERRDAKQRKSSRKNE